MPIDYSRYPANWKTEVVPRIRERSGDQCEWCGVQNKAWIIRFPKDFPERRGYMYVTGPEDICWGLKPTRVILTVAHLGTPKSDGSPGDKHDKHDVRDENLAHLCQSCHLRFDLADHIRHRKENREAKLGILKLPLESPQPAEGESHGYDGSTTTQTTLSG
jgi:hypothetical protein